MNLRTLLLAALVALFLSPAISRADRYRGTGLASVGSIAPDFELPRFDKGKIKLSTLNAAHPVVVWFTNMCAGCQSQIANFKRLRAKYRAKGVEFFAVSMLGDDRATAEAIMKKHSVDYPVLYDPTGSATMKWAGKYVKGTCPMQNIFVIQKGGKIVLADHLPGVEIADLEDAIGKTLGK